VFTHLLHYRLLSTDLTIQPTRQAYGVYNDLASKIDAQLAILAKIKAEDIAAFNKAYTEKNLPVIVVKK
jgi:hypothetical protein